MPSLLSCDDGLEDGALGSPLPKVHVYGDQPFVILHSAEGDDGNARVTHQLFQFVGRRVPVTLNAARDAGPAGEPRPGSARRSSAAHAPARRHGGGHRPPDQCVLVFLRHEPLTRLRNICDDEKEAAASAAGGALMALAHLVRSPPSASTSKTPTRKGTAVKKVPVVEGRAAGGCCPGGGDAGGGDAGLADMAGAIKEGFLAFCASAGLLASLRSWPRKSRRRSARRGSTIRPGRRRGTVRPPGRSCWGDGRCRCGVPGRP